MNNFYTSDLGLASAMVSVGIPLISLDKSNPKRVEFVFEETKELQEAINSYWSSDLLVSPLTYFNAMKMLKNRIYSA